MNILTYVILFFSILFITLGSFIWRKQIVFLTFDFNYRNVMKEDLKQYTTSFGIAYIILGIAMFLLALSMFTNHDRFKDTGFIIFLIGFVISIIIIVKTQIKYKTGCFNN